MYSLIKRAVPNSLLHISLLVFCGLSVYPFVFLFVSSYKPDIEIYKNWWSFFPQEYAWNNYQAAWGVVSKYMTNSLIVSGVSIVGVVVLSMLTGYAFARVYFLGKYILFISLFVLLLIPDILTLAPAFVLVKNLGLLNTWGALIFPYIAGGQLIGIFIMRNYIESLPREIFEASKIDGASESQVFIKIIIPLTMPMAVTIAILTAVGVWNDYLWPLITINNDDLRTVAIGLQYFTTQHTTKVGHLMAANVISSIPILLLFVFGTKYFVHGVMSGSVKG
jgi:ABC-type glycerol-3-phosphate transport system permease component